MDKLASRGINEDFLTKVLKEKVQDGNKSLRIDAITLSKGCGGEGYLSDVVPMKLQWNEPEEARKHSLPTTIVAKVIVTNSCRKP